MNAAGRLKLPLRPLDRSQVLVHGHCHQKSFGAFAPVLTVLGWIPGLDVQAVASALRAVYLPWLEESAERFQALAVARPLPTKATGPSVTVTFPSRTVTLVAVSTR